MAKKAGDGTTRRTDTLPCEGSRVAFGRHDLGAHTTKKPWPACWKCHAPLGCPKCTASHAQELLCEFCIVWATKEALLRHGPIANTPAMIRLRGNRVAPPLTAYPTDWQIAYKRSGPDFVADVEARAPLTPDGIRASLEMVKRMSNGLPMPLEDLVMEILHERAQAADGEIAH